MPATAVALPRPVGPDFADLDGLEAHLRRVHAPFGPLTDAQWRQLARHSARVLPDGRIAPHYDPGIAAPVLAQEEAQALDLSFAWSRVAVPVLLIRGAESDLLEAGIIDPVKVTRSAVANAASIARMVLTTESAVVEKKEEEPAAAGGHGHGHGHGH